MAGASDDHTALNVEKLRQTGGDKQHAQRTEDSTGLHRRFGKADIADCAE